MLNIEEITSSGTPQQQQPGQRSCRPWGCYRRSRSPRKPQNGFLKLRITKEIITFDNNPNAFYIVTFSPFTVTHGRTEDNYDILFV